MGICTVAAISLRLVTNVGEDTAFLTSLNAFGRQILHHPQHLVSKVRKLLNPVPTGLDEPKHIQELFSGVQRHRSAESGPFAGNAYRGSNAKGQFKNLTASLASQPTVALTWLAFLTPGWLGVEGVRRYLQLFAFDVRASMACALHVSTGCIAFLPHEDRTA